MPCSRPTWYLTHEYVSRNQTCDLQKLQVAPLTVPLFLQGRFGGEVIGRNDPGYQEKIVKFNELLANCVIYQNACDITAAANALAADGHPVDPDDLATIAPYITHTIRRFGDWVLDLSPPEAVPVTALNLAPGALFPGGRFDPYPG